MEMTVTEAQEKLQAGGVYLSNSQVKRVLTSLGVTVKLDDVKPGTYLTPHSSVVHIFRDLRGIMISTANSHYALSAQEVRECWDQLTPAAIVPLHSTQQED